MAANGDASRFEHLEKLLLDVKESLEREFKGTANQIGKLEHEFRTAADRIEKAVKRHDLAIVSGTLAIAEVRKHLAELDERVKRLEEGQ
jgi:hypothetical protein